MQLFEQHGLIMNHKKVIRIMRKYGLECKIRRRKSYGNTFNKQRIENTYENLLDTTFDCTEPTTVFHTDITYIKYAHGRKIAYLSAVKEKATREISAYATSESLEMSFVLSTLEGLKKLNISSNAIIHSDQGVHYTSHYTSSFYKDKIQELGLKESMSRRGKCVDNAPIESFFEHLKDELNFNKLETYEDVVEVINNYVYKYNHLRPQWALKKMTPVKYRNHLLNIA